MRSVYITYIELYLHLQITHHECMHECITFGYISLHFPRKIKLASYFTRQHHQSSQYPRIHTCAFCGISREYINPGISPLEMTPSAVLLHIGGRYDGRRNTTVTCAACAFLRLHKAVPGRSSEFDICLLFAAFMSILHAEAIIPRHVQYFDKFIEAMADLEWDQDTKSSEVHQSDSVDFCVASTKKLRASLCAHALHNIRIL